MIRRTLTRLRFFLPVLLLVTLLGNLTPCPVYAKVYIEIDDGLEGDPGDGVLDPAVGGAETGPSGAETSIPTSSISTGGTGFVWQLPLSKIFLLPIGFPGQYSGLQFVDFLPQVWAYSGHLTDRGWHNAP